eukprot:15455659-Alexandrium_andersonii.AAC.1
MPFTTATIMSWFLRLGAPSMFPRHALGNAWLRGAWLSVLGSQTTGQQTPAMAKMRMHVNPTSADEFVNSN